MTYLNRSGKRGYLNKRVYFDMWEYSINFWTRLLLRCLRCYILLTCGFLWELYSHNNSKRVESARHSRRTLTTFPYWHNRGAPLIPIHTVRTQTPLKLKIDTSTPNSTKSSLRIFTLIIRRIKQKRLLHLEWCSRKMVRRNRQVERNHSIKHQITWRAQSLGPSLARTPNRYMDQGKRTPRSRGRVPRASINSVSNLKRETHTIQIFERCRPVYISGFLCTTHCRYWNLEPAGELSSLHSCIGNTCRVYKYYFSDGTVAQQ